MKAFLHRILRPVASLYLTVPLLALSMILVFAGTWAQRVTGVDQVVHDYFRSWVAWIDPRIFLRGVHAGDPEHGVIPFLGGKTLIFLLLINVLAAHAVRFKLTWKRSGILLIHFALVLLLTGELLTAWWAVEGQVTFKDGETVSYASDIRHPELAVIDPSAPDHDHVIAVDDRLLKSGAVIDSPSLPFEIRVDDWYPNSATLGPAQAEAAHLSPRATAGEEDSLVLEPRPVNSGTDASEQVDMPGAYVTLAADGRPLGTYLLSTELLTPQHVQVNGKTWEIALRFRRYYKPYTLTLLHFSHDRYLGTDEAKNFSSRVRLVDPSRHVDREVLIWMNHPLRYRGDTIYQQGFMPGDQYTTLQYAWNSADPLRYAAALISRMGLPAPADPLPYIACFLGALGMLIHFGMHLIGFLRRRGKAVRTTFADAGATEGRWTLAPTRLPPWRRPGFLLSAIVVGCAGAYIASMAVRAGVNSADPYDFAAFGRLPVVSDGRVLPYDSLARNTLRIVHGSETLERGDQTIPAIQWLLDGFAAMPQWKDDALIRIDHPDVIGLLHLPPNQKYFSIADIMPHLDELQRQAQLAEQTSADRRDVFQSKLLQLADSWRLLNKVIGGFLNWQMYVIPPAAPGEQWRTINQVVEEAKKTGRSPETALLFSRMIEDYRNSKPASFNADVGAYAKFVGERDPSMLRRTEYEAYLNRFDPFYICILLYTVVLVLGFGSWLGMQRRLSTAALALLMLTLAVHTFGLVSRVWLQGRPPVTNLYSSAIFIAWGAALFCVLLEWIYRNGVAAVTAAAMGFVTLVIALHLSADAHLQPNGDTMAVLQAVLDTNLWLATHVVCITLGYASTFLAGFLAIVFVVRGLVTRSLDPDLRKDLIRMVYGIVCFAMFFSFVGTILGGIWADQSWGRFWGWDPKENGAILIVLWNALILHARWCGMVRERGFALLAIFGNVITSWSWFGTNMLGIGLHSYGFMDAAVPWLLAFDLSQLVLIAVGALLLPSGSSRGSAPSVR